MKVRAAIKKEVLIVKLYAEKEYYLLSIKRILDLNNVKDKLKRMLIFKLRNTFMT